jgi:ribosomal-protein-alanine N-acetyltransferase
MITNHEIAIARLADAAAIALLSRDAIEHGLTWSWTERRVAKTMRDAETNAIVARERGTLTGFAMMKYRDDEAHLLLMAVQPARRRCGVGSALLNWLELTVRVAGLTGVRVEARDNNIGARAFYASHGYRAMQNLRGYYQGVADAVVLYKAFHS